LVKCPKGHAAHADVNAALNILKRGASLLGCEVKAPERVKVLSFTPAISGILPAKRKARKGKGPDSPALQGGVTGCARYARTSPSCLRSGAIPPPLLIAR